jgi:hypothetical protein
MPVDDSEWLASGTGQPPSASWGFATDAPLADVQLARETGETLAADVAGGLYRLNAAGRIVSMSRGFKHLKALAWTDTGTSGAAVFGTEQIVRFDGRLQISWSKKLPGPIVGISVDPFGHFIAAGLGSSQTMVFAENKRLACEFPSVRPLHFLRFVPTYRDLVAAADYGVIQRQHLNGEAVWEERVLGTVGDLAVTGNGRFAYLAAFSHGVQVYDAEGYNHAGYVVQGAPSRISTSFDGSTIIVATEENYLYRMTPRGELLWAAEAPDAVTRVLADPLGQGFVCGFASGRILRLDWPA